MPIDFARPFSAPPRFRHRHPAAIFVLATALAATVTSVVPAEASTAQAAHLVAGSRVGAALDSDAALLVSTASAATGHAKPTPLPGRSTATSTTQVEPDGSLTTELHSSPVNYRDGHGRWAPISNELVASSAHGYAVRNDANDYTLSIPDDASTTPVRFASGADVVTWQLHGLDGSARVHDNAATFGTAADASSVQYEAKSSGVKESIVLDHAPTSSPSYVFDLDVSRGLTPRLTRSGSVDLVRADGSVPYSLPAPFMTDSATSPVTSTAVSYALRAQGQRWVLTVTPDESWLTDPDRAYPVVIDPTLVKQERMTDCWVDSVSTTADNCDGSNNYLRVGRTSAPASRRALLKFDLSSIPANATVSSADLALYLDKDETRTGPDADYIIRRAMQPVTNNSTWAKPDSTKSATWTGGGPWPSGDPTYGTLTLSGTVTGWKHWAPTSLVSQWVKGTLPNNGLVLKQSGESTAHAVAFYSSDYASFPEDWPKLTVNYTEPTLPAATQAGEPKYFSFTDEQLDKRLTARVNNGNGNLLVKANDLSAAGTAGLDLAMDRYYNSSLSGSSDASKLGAGWSDGLAGSVRLEFPNNDNNRVLFFGPSAYRVRFERNAGGGYIRQEPGLDGDLSYDSSTSTYKVQGFDKKQFLFNTSGRLTTIKDKQGNQITFTYNADGTPANATDTRNRKLVYGYRTDGLLGSVELQSSAGTPLVRYVYTYTTTSPARLASSRLDYVNTNALGDTNDTTNVGAQTTYAYDVNGRLSRIQDPRENTSGDGGTTTVTYDTSGRTATVNRLTDDTSIPDSTSTYSYGTDTGSGTSCNGKGTHRVTVDGERTDVSDTTTYCADSDDRVVRTVDALGHKRSQSYTSNSNVSTFDGSGLDSGGSSFSFDYDSNDNPMSVSTPTGGDASASYGDSTNPHFPTAMRDFDTGGQSSAAATWTYDYDSKGNLIQAKAAVTSGKEITYQYCWDGKGQLQRIDPPDAGGASSTTLDNDTANGCGTTNQGNDTILSYDSLGQLTTIDAPGAHRTQTYTYDALSRVKTMTDGRGVRVTYTYDGLDQVVSESFGDDPTDSTTPPTGSATATVDWTFDADGNLTDLDDPTGHASFAYDELNRTVHQSQQTPSSYKTYTYDPADNVRSVEAADDPEATTYTYNAVNLVTSVNDQRTGGRSVTFDYDRHDKRTKTVYPMSDGNDVVQAARYGDGGQLKCIYSYRTSSAPTNSADNCPSSTFTGLITYTGYSYTSPLGFDTNTRYKQTDLGGATTSFTYDPISRIQTATSKTSSGTQTRKFSYDYDRHSNLTKEDVTGTTPGLVTGTTTYAYNDADELCWTASATPANTCGTVPSGATTYGFDGAGAETSSSAGLTALYNVIGQTSSIDPAGSQGAVPMTYQGVSQDRRLTKASVLMTYGYSGQSAQATNSGQPHSEWFVRDPDGKIVSMVDRDMVNPDRYYLTDGNESVVATIDTSGQVRRYLYEPYGKEIRTWVDTSGGGSASWTSKGSDSLSFTGGEVTDGTFTDGSEAAAKPIDAAVEYNPFRFASGYFDQETGLLKFGTRYYQPDLGRWTQTDPKAGKPQNPLSMNPYLYVGDNPINTTDMQGRDWWDPTSWSADTWTTIGVSIIIGGAAIATAGAFLAAGLGAELALLGVESSIDAIGAGAVIGGGFSAGLIGAPIVGIASAYE